MAVISVNRRSLLVAAGTVGAAALIQSPIGAMRPALAQGFEPTRSMRGGSNNYRPNAPLVDDLGSGFEISGLVREAGTGAPLEGVRIQIWASTTTGGERDSRNHGSVLTDRNGVYRLEMNQIISNFGQPHAHLAYDDPQYKTVFLRPLLGNRRDTSLQADFVLASA